MSIRDLLNAKAIELALADGVDATVIHVHAAVAHLAAELRREFDALVSDFRPAGSAHAAAASIGQEPAQPSLPAQICAGEGEANPAPGDAPTADAPAVGETSVPEAAPPAASGEPAGGEAVAQESAS